MTHICSLRIHYPFSTHVSAGGGGIPLTQTSLYQTIENSQ